MENAGDRIKALRKKKGWTQEDLSRHIGFGVSTISAWEVGRNVPKQRALLRLSKELDADAVYILHGFKKEPMIAPGALILGLVGKNGAVTRIPAEVAKIVDAPAEDMAALEVRVDGLQYIKESLLFFPITPSDQSDEAVREWIGRDVVIMWDDGTYSLDTADDDLLFLIKKKMVRPIVRPVMWIRLPVDF